MSAANATVAARANGLALRRWWAWIVYSALLSVVGFITLAVYGIEFQTLAFMVSLALLAGGACLLAFSLRGKGLGKLRLPLGIEGVLGVLFFFADWVLNTYSFDYYDTRADLLVLMLAGWSMACAALALLLWRALSMDRERRAAVSPRMAAASAAAHAFFAVVIMYIGSYELTSSDSASGNIMILAVVLVALGVIKAAVAIEPLGTSTALHPRRRWWAGLAISLLGTFLLMAGVFAFTYTDLVPDGDGSLSGYIMGHPYIDEAVPAMVAGAALLAIGLPLAWSGWKEHAPIRERKRTVAVAVVLVLLTQALAAMLIVNPGALDYDGGIWDLQEGDYLEYQQSTVVYDWRSNLTTGEMADFTLWYVNFTLLATVTEVAGRSDFYFKWSFSADGNISEDNWVKTPKGSEILLPWQPLLEPHLLREEAVSTPWGPRSCERYSVQSQDGYGGLYSFDRWVKDGLEVIWVEDYRWASSSEAERHRHTVGRLVSTSLEEVTQGPSDPGGPAIRAWSPRDGDHLLYHQTGGSAGGGQATDWDYLVRSVAEEGMVLNLTITTDAQPPQTILSGESVHPLENTSLGVAFCPYPSAGPFAVELVGNETLQTPYGPLECNHLLVLRLGNGTDDRWREDLFVRQGVLVRMERLDQDQFRMDLIETNLDL